MLRGIRLQKGDILFNRKEEFVQILSETDELVNRQRCSGTVKLWNMRYLDKHFVDYDLMMERYVFICNEVNVGDTFHTLGAYFDVTKITNDEIIYIRKNTDKRLKVSSTARRKRLIDFYDKIRLGKITFPHKSNRPPSMLDEFIIKAKKGNFFIKYYKDVCLIKKYNDFKSSFVLIDPNGAIYDIHYGEMVEIFEKGLVSEFDEPKIPFVIHEIGSNARQTVMKKDSDTLETSDRTKYFSVSLYDKIHKGKIVVEYHTPDSHNDVNWTQRYTTEDLKKKLEQSNGIGKLTTIGDDMMDAMTAAMTTLYSETGMLPIIQTPRNSGKSYAADMIRKAIERGDAKITGIDFGLEGIKPTMSVKYIDDPADRPKELEFKEISCSSEIEERMVSSKPIKSSAIFEFPFKLSETETKNVKGNKIKEKITELFSNK